MPRRHARHTWFMDSHSGFCYSCYSTHPLSMDFFAANAFFDGGPVAAAPGGGSSQGRASSPVPQQSGAQLGLKKPGWVLNIPCQSVEDIPPDLDKLAAMAATKVSSPEHASTLPVAAFLVAQARASSPTPRSRSASPAGQHAGKARLTRTAAPMYDPPSKKREAAVSPPVFRPALASRLKAATKQAKRDADRAEQRTAKLKAKSKRRTPSPSRFRSGTHAKVSNRLPCGREPSPSKSPKRTSGSR